MPTPAIMRITTMIPTLTARDIANVFDFPSKYAEFIYETLSAKTNPHIKNMLSTADGTSKNIIRAFVSPTEMLFECRK
jgi:hypothetical protein